MGPEGAACDNLLTSDPVTLNLQQWALKWDSLQDPQVCTVATTFADLKADIEKLCSDSNYCTYQMTSEVQALSTKLNKVISSSKKQKP